MKHRTWPCSLHRWVGRHISRLHDSIFEYRRVLKAVVVESGAIYSSALVIEITLYLLNNAFYIIHEPIAQLTVSIFLSMRP